MRAAFLFAFSLVVSGQPLELLEQVRAKVAASLDRLPRYMCTQTIDRYQYDAAGYDRRSACDQAPGARNNTLTTSDRLRLDVAIAQAAEMYS